MSYVLHYGTLYRNIDRYLDPESKLNLRLVDSVCNELYHLQTTKLRLNCVELTYLKKFSHLTDIDCTSSRVTNTIIRRFPPSVKTLNISHCKRVAGLLDLSRLYNLKRLTCHYTNVLNATLDTLSPALTELDISYASGLDNPDLSRFTELEELHTIGCSGVRVNNLRLAGLGSLRRIYSGATKPDQLTVETIPLSVEVLVIRACDIMEPTNVNLSSHLRLKVFECHIFWSIEMANRLPISLEKLRVWGILHPSESELPKLTSLKEIKCEYTSMREVTPETIPPFVEVLSLGSDSCIDIDCFDLTGNDNLKEFHLRSLGTLYDNLLDRLPRSMVKIDINTGVSSTALNYSKFRNLQHLVCNVTNIVEITSETLPLSLESLNIRDCLSVGDHSFDLTNHVRLNNLDCSGTRLTDKAIEKLPLSLEKLNISECPHLTNIDLSEFSSLKELICKKTDVRVVSAKTIPLSIEVLDFRDSHNIDPDSFDLTKHTRLNELDCSRAASLNNVSVKRLPTSLKRLNLSGCSRINNLDLSRCMRLRELDCSFTNIVEVNSNSLPVSLVDLNIGSCPKVNCDRFDLTKHVRLVNLDCSNVLWSNKAIRKLPPPLRYLTIDRYGLKHLDWFRYPNIEKVECVNEKSDAIGFGLSLL